MMVRIYILLFLFFGLGQTISAQIDKIDTDRPDQTESVLTVPKKWLQFEAGFNVQQNGQGMKEYVYPTLLTRYAVTKNFELRLITNYRQDRINKTSVSGLEPVEIGGKIALIREHNLIPAITFIGHLALPRVSSKAHRADHSAPNFRFSLQHSLSNKTALGYNVGTEWDDKGVPTYIYTLAIGHNLTKALYSYLEGFGGISNTRPEHSIDAGFAYTFGNNFKLDLSGGKGLSHNAADWYTALGISFRFNTALK